MILVNVDRAGIDGLLTAEAIRRQSEDTPIVLLVDADIAGQQMFREDSLGLVDFVTRPFVPEVVRSKMNVLIELHYLRRENAKLLRELRAANEGKDHFLSILSHEIRTPLNAILGWIQVMRNKRVDEVTMARAMEAVERNAKAQAGVIQDMLDVSQIITGRIHLNFQLVEFETAVTAAIEGFRATAEAKNIRIDAGIDHTGTRIAGDPQRLRQIVGNLLSNALKFTSAGGSVSVRLQRDDNRVRLTVTDTGCGIDPNFLPFVFDRFRQAHPGVNRKHGGLGLGLSIAQQLVQFHGGMIEAASEGEGKGARFTVYLPIREVVPAAITANAG